MGRAPCCDKANVKKGPWSLEEDAKLKSYIEKHGTGGNWIALPKKIGLKRCGKSCRLRWLNYLRPNIKRGGFSEEEENIICSLYISIGSRWSIIAAQLPGRTDNDLKNYWNTSLKKKLLGKQTQKDRRKSKQNQEMRKIKDHNNYIVPSDHNNNNQNPYWQDQPQVVLPPPIPYSIEEPRFNDHTSIRKLLIKLGGRFSNDDQPINSFPNHQYTPPPPPVDQLNMLSSPTPIDVLNTCLPEMAMLTTQNSYASELEQMIYNNPKIFEGLEFLCGDMMMNSRIGGGCGGSSAAGWDDQMSSNLLLPCHVTSSSDFEGQQGTTLLRRMFNHEVPWST